ncbi:hypothetical protein L1987_60444 [Smallanthus sonchifolius]|uniref:Uncharacterized protein n=1 Tax=Smallanthus sonchifolius TaxID=185202 RepID=A0ACB9D8A7_9ASTR|nr:hypothetical protein L1987_60444 [Smallanthus sonchifolius]
MNEFNHVYRWLFYMVTVLISEATTQADLIFQTNGCFRRSGWRWLSDMGAVGEDDLRTQRRKEVVVGFPVEGKKENEGVVISSKLQLTRVDDRLFGEGWGRRKTQ